MAGRPGGMVGGVRRGEPGSLQPGAGAALRRATGFLRSYWRDSAGALVALFLVSATNLVAPQLIRLAIDEGVAGRQVEAIAIAVVGMVGVAVLRGLFTFLQGFLAERASQGVAYELRDTLFTKLQRLSFSYYDGQQTGQLLTRLTSDVEQIRTFAGTGLVQICSSVVMLLGSAILLFILNWQLAIVALAVMPLIALILFRFIGRIGPLFSQVQGQLSKLNTILQEDLAGVRVIRAFAREDYERGRYRAANDDLLEKNLATIRVFSEVFPFVFFFANLGTLGVILFGGLQVIGGSLTIGELIAFNTYLGLLIFPLLSLGFLASMVPRAAASSSRIFEIIDAPLDVTDKPDAVALPPLVGRVEFRDVRFRYPGSDREILGGLNFVVEPGQTVAILGTTGSGKSTIVNLLPRFYDATAGSVLIDGQDVRDVTIASVRGQIGIVLQETLLFSGTVRDNIAYGRPDATPGAIEAAARAAQAAEFIAALPQGYDTIVGERGVGLSGGQRQRIAIARALLIDPRLLILDDSTSAVDAGTEGAIQEALERLMRDAHRTAFVIAQRISTVRDADLILVLDGGQIVARGTHEELLRESELYNEILGSQLVRAEAGVVAD
ncbi:MAG: Heterodimeric efflux ABC transporter, permease/ATP-binding subunit 1 [uncultured Thermomicrobiales bacterium]|uniref:Multidrug resistance-like ATP-binding protein MdlA n=1 Tax=uncultured Thermomicrobiales bacterium TaxID=1645740 RepID=A0A6J4UID7_9BACT|nr:MAG: Heterodimeric efflux ABC transporter, permease/ATP-binding subunit 1 [uncultured Thermomicrobiales bacterium]